MESKEQLINPLLIENGELNKKEVKIDTKDLYHTKLRFVFITLSFCAGMGICFCYDAPVPLFKRLIAPVSEKGMGLTLTQYNLLFTLLCAPNFILPFFGGFMTDKILGKRKGIFIFSLILLMGQFLFSLSTIIVPKNEQFGRILILTGRLIFGIGCESFLVTINALINLWFQDQEKVFAMGIFYSSFRVASMMNDNLQPLFYRISGNSFTFGYFVSFLFCLMSFIVTIFIIRLDFKAEKSQAITKNIIEVERIQIGDILKFEKTFWYIIANCGITYMSYFSFNTIASGLYQDRFGFSQQMAGFLISIPSLIAMILNPFSGIIADFLGNKLIFIISANILIMIGHFILAFIHQSEIGEEQSYFCLLPIVMFGFALGMYTCTIWPTVSQYVEKKYSAIAFGIGISIQNIGIGIGPFLISFVRQHTLNIKKGYFWVNILCCLEALIGLLSCLLSLKIILSKLSIEKANAKNNEKGSGTKIEMINYNQLMDKHLSKQ